MYNPIDHIAFTSAVSAKDILFSSLRLNHSLTPDSPTIEVY